MSDLHPHTLAITAGRRIEVPELVMQCLAAGETAASIVGLSTLLTTTMPAMRDTVKAIRESGLSVKIVGGGAPITREFAREIGADGSSLNAGSAVDEAMSLLRA